MCTTVRFIQLAMSMGAVETEDPLMVSHPRDNTLRLHTMRWGTDANYRPANASGGSLTPDGKLLRFLRHRRATRSPRPWASRIVPPE